jgi:hypothetical protein
MFWSIRIAICGPWHDQTIIREHFVRIVLAGQNFRDEAYYLRLSRCRPEHAQM